MESLFDFWKPSAERNFLKLAARAGPQDAAVQQLLFLWGPRPDAHQLDWLEHRARSASGAERSQWLRHLSDRGASDRVIQISEVGDAIPGINSPERDVYLDVIVNQRDSDRLRRFIRGELSQEIGPAKVRQLAKLAVQESLPKVATEAYRSLFTLRPGDVEAAGWLGRVAYAEDRREEAMELIALTLEKDSDDYESHYIYGELLYADERRVEALPHLRKAKEMIEASARKTVEMRLAWGQALFRLGHLQQAIDIYAGLYAERSNDPGIRADYASLLIDARDYQRAQTVLWSN
jgi:tetratricopeptide (TPR) repeat protein